MCSQTHALSQRTDHLSQTSAVNLSKRTEKIILLIMDEEITLREKKRQRCWSLLKNVREEIGEDLATEAKRINFEEKKLQI